VTHALNKVQERMQCISRKRQTNTYRTTQKVTHVLNKVQERKQCISRKRQTNTYRTTQKVTHVLNEVQERKQLFVIYFSYNLLLDISPTYGRVHSFPSC